MSAVTMGKWQAGIKRTRHQDPSKAREIELWVDQLATSYEILPMDTQCFREWGRMMASSLPRNSCWRVVMGQKQSPRERGPRSTNGCF